MSLSKKVEKILDQFFQKYNEEIRLSIRDGNFKDSNQEDFLFDEIQKLHLVINKENFNKISKKALYDYIDEYNFEYQYDIVKDLIKKNKIKNKEKAIELLLSKYGETFDERIEYIYTFMKDKFYFPQKRSFINFVNEVKENIKIINFKNRLNEEKSNISIEDVDKLSGIEFEKILKQLFERQGYSVKETKVTQDQGADLVLENLVTITVVQAKRYQAPIGNKAIQEVVASLKHYKAHNGMVVTNSKFTKSAIDLAKSNNIKLISRTELKKWLKV